MDIGESLVGAYMRQVRGCHTVAFNTRLQQQGELDVVGVANGAYGAEVWLAEVAIHLDGLNYAGGTNVQTVDKDPPQSSRRTVGPARRLIQDLDTHTDP